MLRVRHCPRYNTCSQNGAYSVVIMIWRESKMAFWGRTSFACFSFVLGASLCVTGGYHDTLQDTLRDTLQDSLQDSKLGSCCLVAVSPQSLLYLH